jgi:hypothetical protein
MLSISGLHPITLSCLTSIYRLSSSPSSAHRVQRQPLQKQAPFSRLAKVALGRCHRASSLINRIVLTISPLGRSTQRVAARILRAAAPPTLRRTSYSIPRTRKSRRCFFRSAVHAAPLVPFKLACCSSSRLVGNLISYPPSIAWARALYF